MPVLVFLFVLSFSFYVYYKIKFVRSRLPMVRKYLSGKSGVSLGLFVGLFGVNELYLYHTATTYIIASIFILIGLLSIWSGCKSFLYYRSFAAKELEEANSLKSRF
ncbi:YtpI family protein [Heyndrickxia acidicola]|uniref:YtpI family protein n=1 Tax=Heyndrickxia acidicola TaxID=209389 RepID=A0ABU6MJI2_9BACI|nr:YtpI family protein [Heyndrickxia acidicola]MED1203205.1 YtpI family protein [Heyndrickxia acidicola]